MSESYWWCLFKNKASSSSAHPADPNGYASDGDEISTRESTQIRQQVAASEPDLSKVVDWGWKFHSRACLSYGRRSYLNNLQAVYHLWLMFSMLFHYKMVSCSSWNLRGPYVVALGRSVTALCSAGREIEVKMSD